MHGGKDVRRMDFEMSNLGLAAREAFICEI